MLSKYWKFRQFNQLHRRDRREKRKNSIFNSIEIAHIITVPIAKVFVVEKSHIRCGIACQSISAGAIISSYILYICPRALKASIRGRLYECRVKHRRRRECTLLQERSMRGQKRDAAFCVLFVKFLPHCMNPQFSKGRRRLY